MKRHGIFKCTHVKSTAFLFLAILGLFATSCKTGQQAVASPNDALGGVEAADSLFLTFERTPCFGKCPAFRVKLYRNGHASYEGIQFAEHMGMHIGKVDPSTVLAIHAEAQKFDFFNLESKYDGPVTDLPSMIFQMSANAKTHKILARYKVPAELKAYGKYLDQVFDGIRWTPAPSRE